MRFTSVRFSAVLFALPLAAASCASPPPDPGSPVPAQLTDRQASVLARDYLDTKKVATPRTLVGEEKQQQGWWLWYDSAFDPAAKPPQARYLVDVNNDGTVHEVGG
jgi:hypothetical protein